MSIIKKNICNYCQKTKTHICPLMTMNGWFGSKVANVRLVAVVQSHGSVSCRDSLYCFVNLLWRNVLVKTLVVNNWSRMCYASILRWSFSFWFPFNTFRYLDTYIKSKLIWALSQMQLTAVKLLAWLDPLLPGNLLFCSVNRRYSLPADTEQPTDRKSVV